MTREEFLNEFPALVGSYRPAPDVLAKINGVELLMVIGPSGVGKTSIIDQLKIPFIPSCTTRDPRPGEVNGRDFYFLKDYQLVFDDIESGRFVQIAVGPSGHFYATLASSYPAIGIAAMPVVADVVPVFRSLGFKRTLSAFVVPPDYDEWMRRMEVHRLSGEHLERRLAEAHRSFEFALSDGQVHFILNDDLGDAVRQVENLLKGMVDPAREAEAKQTVKRIFAKLQANG